MRRLLTPLGIQPNLAVTCGAWVCVDVLAMCGWLRRSVSFVLALQSIDHVSAMAEL